jgi:hypothetical protein
MVHGWAASMLAKARPGPALGEQDLRISDDVSQTRAVVPLLSRPSVRGVPQLHGSTTLVERRRTIYFRAEISNVAEQERYNKVRICRSRCDSANDHEKSMCASSHHLPRSPALSVTDVSASQASSRVDVRPRCSCSAAVRRAVARRARQRSLCDLFRRQHVAGHAERPATDEL